MKTVAFIGCIMTTKGRQRKEELVLEITTRICGISKCFSHVPWLPPQPYVLEMGKPLRTEIFILARHFTDSDLVEVKRTCMRIEEQFLLDGGRQFNLNPGYLCTDGMFLLTHKPNPLRGRVLLGEGVWKEQQYLVRGDRYIPIHQTFSEYGNRQRLASFNTLARGLLKIPRLAKRVVKLD